MPPEPSGRTMTADPPRSGGGGGGGGLLRFRQAKWQDPTVGPATKHSTVLIKHDVTPQNRRVLVLVHGLRGDTTQTWGDFPRLIFECSDLQRFDIALFGYRTGGLSAILPSRHEFDVRAQGRTLAQLVLSSLIEQERYDRISFVAHGVGGIVAKFCIQELIRRERKLAAKLHSLFLYGTPQFGSRRAASASTFFAPEVRAVESSSDELDELKSFWYSNITHDPNTSGGTRIFLEERAVVSTKDSGSHQGSGVGSLPERNVMRVEGGHSSLVKPKDAHDPRFRYLRHTLSEIEKRWGGFIQQVIRHEADQAAADGREHATHNEDTERAARDAFQAEYVVDVGAAAGIKEGDVFRILRDGAPDDDDTNGDNDSASQFKGLLVVQSVEQDSSSCELKEFQYLDQVAVQQSLPSEGDEVVRLRNEHWSRVEPMDRWYKRATDRERSVDERRHAHVQVLIQSADFLEQYPNSYFAEMAQWHRARSSLVLGRYDEAIHALEKYETRFPLAASRRAVRDAVTEATLRRAVLESKGSDQQAKARLGEFLIKSAHKANRAEGVRLIADVALEDYENLINVEADHIRLVAALFLKRITGWDNRRVRGLLYQRYHTDADARAELAALCYSSEKGDRDRVTLEALLRGLGYEL